MQKQALYLSQNSIKNLYEIGEGTLLFIVYRSLPTVLSYQRSFCYCIIGHFGKVYKGIYTIPGGTDQGIVVAIKTIKQYECKTETANFLKEMSIMSSLIHPNIVRFYGLVQKGNY